MTGSSPRHARAAEAARSGGGHAALRSDEDVRAYTRWFDAEFTGVRYKVHALSLQMARVPW